MFLPNVSRAFSPVFLSSFQSSSHPQSKVAEKRIVKATSSKEIQWQKYDSFLCPISELFSFDKLDVEDYLKLLDETGRMVKGDKKGAIAENLKPILTRIELNEDKWLNTVMSYGGMFPRVAGKTDSIKKAAKKANCKWFKGIRIGKLAFT